MFPPQGDNQSANSQQMCLKENKSVMMMLFSKQTLNMSTDPSESLKSITEQVTFIYLHETDNKQQVSRAIKIK